jgi:hypothetical protein
VFVFLGVRGLVAAQVGLSGPGRLIGSGLSTQPHTRHNVENLAHSLRQGRRVKMTTLGGCEFSGQRDAMLSFSAVQGGLSTVPTLWSSVTLLREATSRLFGL